MGSPFTLIERIRMHRLPGTEHTKALIVFYVQHPSNSPAHGSGPNKPPVIHEERITCVDGDLNPLGTYLKALIEAAP